MLVSGFRVSRDNAHRPALTGKDRERSPRSDGSVFLDCDASAIVTTFAAHCVIDVPCAAVGAKSESGSYCLVVSSTFRCTSL